VTGLPADGADAVAGVALPPGRRVADVLWISDGQAQPTAWTGLRQAFPATGLWPLVLAALEGDPRRPWDAGEFEPGSATDPAAVDVAAALARWWEDALPDEDEEEEATAALAPFGRSFPGLAPPSTTADDDGALDAVAGAVASGGRLGLVPVTRPADVFAVLGWTGPANYFGDMGPLSALARSWEERFGAEPVGLGFATALFAVRRPPATPEEANRLAAEHFAVCSDLVYQGDGSIGAYAARLLGAPAWSLWWD
jgi:hypothetical protein